MPEDYVPEYAKGQVLVRFLGDHNLGDFLDLGYIQVDYNPKRKGFSVYRVPVGEEERAILKFKSHSEFVEGAERFDLKFEKRGKIIDSLYEKVSELYGSMINDKEWERLLDESFRDWLDSR
jgi:hypothetical protein